MQRPHPPMFSLSCLYLSGEHNDLTRLAACWSAEAICQTSDFSLSFVDIKKFIMALIELHNGCKSANFPMCD